MAINKKLIHFETLTKFQSADGINTTSATQTPTNDLVGNIPYHSIVFIKDSCKFWTHGKYYDCNNTWRGILNNLTSTSTTDSLSAYQGKILNEKFANYLPLSGGTLTGSLEISTGSDNNNYNEGLRITCANNNWAGITLGSTGRSGAPTNGWFIARNPDKLLILSPDTSSNTTGLTLNKGGDLKWRNNTVYHSGNLPAYPVVTNYYWANIKIKSTSDSATSPTFNVVTASTGNITDATIGNLVVTGGASFALTINGTIDKALKDGSGNTITSTYVKKSGDTMTGLLTTTTGSNHAGLKVGNTYINSINGELILLNNTSIRFGGDSWDYNVWAGLKYIHSSKIIYLGLADGSAFTANSALSGGKLYTPGISNIYIGNGTLTVYHTGNLSIGTLMGSTAIGDSDEPVYWSGSAFVKAGAYPTKASWNYDDVYLKLTGGTLTGTGTILTLSNESGGDCAIKFLRSGNTAWSILDSGGNLSFIEHTSGTTIFKLYESSLGTKAEINGNTVWHAGNLTTSAAADGGTTKSLVTTGDKYKWNLVYDWLTTTTADTDTTINKWKELEAFLSSITESDTLSGLLASRVAKSGDTMTGALTTPSLTVTGASSFSLAINGSILGNAATASRLLNARTISFTGAFTGSYSFDGSANISINTNHSHSYVNTIGISGTTITWSVNGTAQTALLLPTYTNNVTSHLRAGSSGGNANSTSDVDNPYLLLVEGSAYDSQVLLKAGTGISVSAKNGVVTITNSSPDLNHNVTSHLRVGATGATSNTSTDVSDPFLSLVEGSNLDSQVLLKADGGLSITATSGGIIKIKNTAQNSHSYTTNWEAVSANNFYPIAISPNTTPATSKNGYNADFTFNPSTKTFNNNGCRLQYDSTNKVLKFIFD